MAAPLNCRLRILQMIPRKGEGDITASELETWLKREFGIQASKRNIERGLHALSGVEEIDFHIDYQEVGRIKKWYWLGKVRIGIPKMGRHTAFSFHSAKLILGKLMPSDCLRYLKHNFDDAEKLLNKKRERKNTTMVG